MKNQLVRDRLKEVHDREEAQRAHLVIEMNEVGCCSIVVVIYFFLSTKIAPNFSYKKLLRWSLIDSKKLLVHF